MVTTVITNTSGAVRTFDWIPPDGKKLGIGATCTVLGLVENRIETIEKQNAFKADVTASRVSLTVNGL